MKFRPFSFSDPDFYLSALGGSAKWHSYDSSDAGEGFSLTKEMLEVDGVLQQAAESGEIEIKVSGLPSPAKSSPHMKLFLELV